MSEIYTTPFDNPYTKVACVLGVVWLGYIGIRYAKKDGHDSPQSRKSRQALTANSIDKQIDGRNRAYGGKVPSNPDIPFYSRHNYNRRRRAKDLS